MQFEVLTGGGRDIDVEIVEANANKLIYSAERKTRDHAAFTASSGDAIYRICFDNHFSTLTAKELDIKVLCGLRRDAHALVLQVDSLGFAVDSVSELGVAIDGVVNELAYQKVRHYTHEATARSTSERVFYWSLFEAALSFTVALFQVFWMKRYFEQQRSI